MVLDITATLESRQALARTINAVAHEIFLPLTVGGGIRSEDDAAAAIDAGADKVSLNTAALRQPELITTLAGRYGSQAVIVAIDAKRRDDGFAVYVRSGTTDAARDAVAWAKEAESRGAGEILLTSMDRDGTKAGFDCEMTAAVSDAVDIPVIASGGAGSVDHFADVFTRGHADAALAASIFHYAESSVTELEAALARARNPGATVNEHRSVSVRPPMLIPSIDLQDGHVVQLVQGERLAIEAPDPEPWIAKFSAFPRVQLIDLDAARGRGDNRALVQSICGRLPCRVGGGIRSIERAREVLALGRTRRHRQLRTLPRRRRGRGLCAITRRGGRRRTRDRGRGQPRRPRRDSRLEDCPAAHGCRCRPGARAVLLGVPLHTCGHRGAHGWH